MRLGSYQKARICAALAAGSAAGAQVAYHGADMSRVADIEDMMKYSASQFGRVDILVNNAGIQHTASIEEFPVEKWDAILALNLSAVFHATAAALPHMKQQGAGRIINIASIYGLVGGYERSSYVASKHGLVGLTKAVALETAGSPITCNAICPGDVSTRIFYKTAKDLALRENISREEAQRRVAATNMPSGNTVAPDQVAALAAFLCSDAASEMRGSALSMAELGCL